MKRAYYFCRYCGSEYFARAYWPHMATCDKNPKNIPEGEKKGGMMCNSVKSTRKYKLKSSYDGMTEADYDRLLAAQNGVCKLCHLPPNKNGHPNQRFLSVDHKHKSKPIIIRGLLCTNCNHGVGKLKDNPVLMLKAAINCAEFDPSFRYFLPALRTALAQSQPSN